MTQKWRRLARAFGQILGDVGEGICMYMYENISAHSSKF